MDVTQLKERAKARVNETRLDKSGTDNERLRAQNEVLRTELDRAAKDRSRFLDAIEGLQPNTTAPKKHRLRRTMTLAIAAGGAYVAGTKAGRARYEQIRSWWDRTREKSNGIVPEGFGDRASDITAEVKEQTAAVKDQVTDAAASVADTAKKKGSGNSSKSSSRSTS